LSQQDVWLASSQVVAYSYVLWQSVDMVMTVQVSQGFLIRHVIVMWYIKAVVA